MTKGLEDFPPNLQHGYHRKDGWCPASFAAVLAAVKLIVATGYDKRAEPPTTT